MVSGPSRAHGWMLALAVLALRLSVYIYIEGNMGKYSGSIRPTTGRDNIEAEN